MPWWIVTIPLSDFLSAGVAAISSPAAKTAEYRENTPPPAMDRLVSSPDGGVELAASEIPGRLNSLGQLSWRSWFVIAWLGGIAWQVGRMLIQHRRLKRLLRRATPASESRLLTVIEQVAAHLGLPQRPRLVLTDEGGAPFVCGLLHPVLVLPRGLMAELNRDSCAGALARIRSRQAARSVVGLAAGARPHRLLLHPVATGCGSESAWSENWRVTSSPSCIAAAAQPTMPRFWFK